MISQEFPPIQNFAAIDYNAGNQNWGISQSKQKNIYVANNSGLLEFNGAEWRLYGSPNGSTIRSVRAINDKVYTGCYMEFGFWRKNVYGELVYSSISNESKLPLLEDEEFWNIIELDDRVLFQSLERIYIYNTLDSSMKIIDARSKKAHMFNLNKTIYYHKTDRGLYKIEKGEPVLVSDEEVLKHEMVVGMFSKGGKPLLATEKGKFYFLEDGNLVRWNNEFTTNSFPISIYSTRQLSDGSMVLGTISNGIYHLNLNGELQLEINQEKGLNNNTILSIFEDVEQNLWLGMDNGIGLINLDSPFKEYIDKNGTLGVVYACTVHKGTLYLGTNQGLFYKRINVDENFALVEGTRGQVWFLKVIDDTLFCGHNKGTYVVSGIKAKRISEFPGTWDIKPIPNYDNLLLQGNFEGLSVLQKSGDQWKLRNEIDGFDISSRFFEFVCPNRILVNREFKGVFSIALDNDYRQALEVDNYSSMGTGASLVSYDDKILYTCNNGIFQYDHGPGKFTIDSTLTNFFYVDSDDPIGIFIPDHTAQRLWCFTNSNIAYLSAGKLDGKPQINKIPIPSYIRKNLGVLGFESLTPLSNDRYLIGISNGYLTVDLKRIVPKEYPIRLNSIEAKSKSSILEYVAMDSKSSFEYSKNNLVFSYNVPEFDKYKDVYFQYQLEGIYENWSEWSNENNASFENLPYGNYRFNVRAKIGNLLSSNVATYGFRIKRPWYLSNLMIFVYVLALSVLAFFIHKSYKSYYNRQQKQLLQENKRELKRKKLKAQKKIVQIKNEKLQEEVDNKNRELAISTMSIIKKNEFLNAIKDQLKTVQDNPQVKSVIRTIDRNINNSDDWKFFEDAFNNADKNFLKKVKNAHPELTSNDLKLCAYLRLNLSSKEIAPLLNISVRSVEVKRYRLRKKMNLLHENSLTDYIMEI